MKAATNGGGIKDDRRPELADNGAAAVVQGLTVASLSVSLSLSNLNFKRPSEMKK